MKDNNLTPSDTPVKVDSSVFPLPDPIKGKADWREYRSFQLSNGITCTVVHDKESKTTAAAACVDVGAGSDPRSLSGLAHFCEHMCFLGSSKYPGENEYKRYLATHGGRSNASTSLFTTCYKFEVLAESSEKAVDIFSQFFVDPLFTASGTGREVQAVASENSKNLVADARRRLQILKALADPDHYFSKFSTGNEATLPTSDDEKLAWIRDALLTFHRKHYTPQNLTVVLVGPQSLDELQDWLVPRFAPMKARAFPSDVDKMTPVEKMIHEAAGDAPSYAYHEQEAPHNPAFYPKLQGSWPVLITSKPVRSKRQLVMLFPLPSVRKIPDQSPVSVLSHLLGHEGPGSCFAGLQNEGLLSALAAGTRVGAPDFNLFQVQITLTEEGEKRWKEVVDYVFAYCRLMKAAAMEAEENGGESAKLKRIWGEYTSLQKMFFDQASPGTAYGFAPGLASSILSHGTEKCLSAGRFLNESSDTFPTAKIVDFANRLLPTNCIIERSSLQAWDEAEQAVNSGDLNVEKQTEKWYGVDYYMSRIDPQIVENWNGDKTTEDFTNLEYDKLHLPIRNRYIPRTLDLCPDLPVEATLGPRIENEIEPPNLLVQNKVGKLWHRLDDRYALPKASLTILIRNAAVQNIRSSGVWHYDEEASIHSSLVEGMFSEAMAQDTYDAQLAGLGWSLSLSSSGIKISCSGFSDRLPDLALKILKDFTTDLFLQESFFASQKDRVIRNLSTFMESRRADSYAAYYRDMLLASNETGINVSLKKANQITLESARQYHNRLLCNDEATIDCLFSGNVSEKEAKQFFSSVSTIMEEITSTSNRLEPSNNAPWIPGPIERKLVPGNDVQLHFATKNEKEENGAVLVTYQSSIPGFKGDGLSSNESLQSSAAIRLICHILREPLFDDLRTKQQLGYIVSSYYDISFAARAAADASEGAHTTPVDFIGINVLSRKLPPPEVADRIEEFVQDFRNFLLNMPESEIRDHANALSTKLLKPIQKLGDEASNQFGKIRRYGPEILSSGGESKDLPWDSVKVLAREIRSLTRSDIVQKWDLMVKPQSRSRIVSCVYGSSFPLSPEKIKASDGVIVDSVPSLIKLREGLIPFGSKSKANLKVISLMPHFFNEVRNKRIAYGAAAVAVCGVGFIGLSMMSRIKKVGK